MYCTGRLWEINWVEHFHRVSAFNFSAKASDSVPSSCGGKVLLDLASSMRTFQNNSEHNFFQHLRTLSTRQKSDTLLKLHQNQQFFLILNSYSEKMLNVNFSVSRRFFKETLVIWTRITSAKVKREEISNQGRVDNFDGPGEMQRRRRSLSRAGRSRNTSRARETTTTVETGKDKNKERKISTSRGSSRGREMVVERRDEKKERGRSRVRDLQVPMTLRQPFLDDPFFKGTLARLENTREDFFKQARESFEENMKQME